jgi:AcrR family transcriptional regulator
MNTTAGLRSYSSPLRAEQAAATQARVLEAAIDLLQSTDSGDVAIPDVAERAGVSVRTAYRAFPTRQHLLEGVLAELSQRFEAIAGTVPTSLDEFAESAEGAVRAVYEVEPLFRALFATPDGRELHRRTAPQRREAIDNMLIVELGDLTPQQRRRFVAVAHLLSSSRSVLLLKDYHDLDVDDATAAVRWALATLIAAVRDPERRAEL